MNIIKTEHTATILIHSKATSVLMPCSDGIKRPIVYTQTNVQQTEISNVTRIPTLRATGRELSATPALLCGMRELISRFHTEGLQWI